MLLGGNKKRINLRSGILICPWTYEGEGMLPEGKSQWGPTEKCSRDWTFPKREAHDLGLWPRIPRGSRSVCLQSESWSPCSLRLEASCISCHQGSETHFVCLTSLIPTIWARAWCLTPHFCRSGCTQWERWQGKHKVILLWKCRQLQTVKLKRCVGYTR